MKSTICILAAFAMHAAAWSQTAPDFNMETRQGIGYSLDSIATPVAILYLNDPECDECHAKSDSINASANICNALKTGDATLLSVYAGDDVALWKSRKPNSGWTECIDREMSVFGYDEYHFDSLPALFLIDRNHRFLLNGTTVKEIEQWLLHNNPNKKKQDRQ